jgi:pimeloyl-ACP methyl ester carboxylesterase
VLGSSEGGSLAIMLTAMHPERVDRLVLHGTWARHPWIGQPDRPEFGWVQRRWGTGRVLAALAVSLAATAAGRRFLARYERQSATPTTARRLVATMSAIDVTPVLASIAVPTLVVHRDQDAAFDLAHAHALAAGIPGARLVTLSGRDHFLYSGDTATLLAAIRTFVTGTAATEVPERFLATVLVAEAADGRFDAAGTPAAQAASRSIEAHRARSSPSPAQS